METEYRVKQFLKNDREPRLEDMLKSTRGYLSTFKLQMLLLNGDDKQIDVK